MNEPIILEARFLTVGDSISYKGHPYLITDIVHQYWDPHSSSSLSLVLTLQKDNATTEDCFWPKDPVRVLATRGTP